MALPDARPVFSTTAESYHLRRFRQAVEVDDALLLLGRKQAFWVEIVRESHHVYLRDPTEDHPAQPEGISGVSLSSDVVAMTRPPVEQPEYRIPTGETISALGLHHRLKAGRIYDTEIIFDEDGGVQKVITAKEAYELIDRK